MLQVSPAMKEHAPALARLINLAGEGIPEYLWAGMTEGDETALDAGARRAAREDGGFSYRNALICSEADVLLGMVLAYRQDEPCDSGAIKEHPAIIRPLLELESMAPGSWYINAIATYEEHRGRGVARRLLADTELRARSCDCTSLSLIVASGNGAARRLYDAQGFTVTDTRPIVPWPGGADGGDWLLMCRELVT